MSSCGIFGFPRILRRLSIWTGDSGGAGQHLPQCVVNEPDTLWRCDLHVPCTAAYRSPSASYRAALWGFRLIVPRNSHGSASRYGRPQPGHGAPAWYASYVNGATSQRTASRSRSLSRWARSCLAVTANGESRSPRRSYSAVSVTRPTVPALLHRLVAEQVVGRSALDREPCGQCASPLGHVHHPYRAGWSPQRPAPPGGRSLPVGATGTTPPA
jgi:hypothetical protein